MALAISFFFPQTVLGTNADNSILGIFRIGIDNSTNEVYILPDAYDGFSVSELNSARDGSSTESGWFQRGVQYVSSFFQWVVDGLGNILSTLKILLAFTFSPFIFVLNPSLLGGAPFFVKLIFAVPLVFLTFMGGIKFIRGLG
jgi:hypothetical protein